MIHWQAPAHLFSKQSMQSHARQLTCQTQVIWAQP